MAIAEKMEYPNIIRKIMNPSNLVVNGLAKYLRILKSNRLLMLPNGGMSLTFLVIGIIIFVEIFH